MKANVPAILQGFRRQKFLSPVKCAYRARPFVTPQYCRALPILAMLSRLLAASVRNECVAGDVWHVLTEVRLENRH